MKTLSIICKKANELAKQVSRPIAFKEAWNWFYNQVAVKVLDVSETCATVATKFKKNGKWHLFELFVPIWAITEQGNTAYVSQNFLNKKAQRMGFEYLIAL